MLPNWPPHHLSPLNCKYFRHLIVICSGRKWNFSILKLAPHPILVTTIPQHIFHFPSVWHDCGYSLLIVGFYQFDNYICFTKTSCMMTSQIYLHFVLITYQVINLYNANVLFKTLNLRSQKTFYVSFKYFHKVSRNR